MEWEVTIADEKYKIDVPAYLLAQTVISAKVAGKRVRIRWQPLHQVFFIVESDSASPRLERCYRIRSYAIENLVGTERLIVRFQIVGKDSASIEAEISPLSRARAVKRLGQKSIADKQYSPLTGKLTKLYVRSGQTIRKGDQVAIIEAMKMENKIVSELAGVVHKVPVQEQGKVNMGEVIFSIVPTESA